MTRTGRCPVGSRITTVNDVMTTALMTVGSDETIESADFQMKLTDVRHLPVVGPGNQLVGIVSERDMLRAWSGPSSRPVSEIMSRRLHTVRPGDPAIRALDLLLA